MHVLYSTALELDRLFDDLFAFGFFGFLRSLRSLDDLLRFDDLLR